MIQTHLLRLEPPYKVIYSGGQIARHVGTLIVTEEKRGSKGEYGITTHSHPVVDYGTADACGQVWDDAELSDCNVLGVSDSGKITWYYFCALIESYFNAMEGSYRSSFVAVTMYQRLLKLGLDIIPPQFPGNTIQVRLDYIPKEDDAPELVFYKEKGQPELVFDWMISNDVMAWGKDIRWQANSYETLLSQLCQKQVQILFSTQEDKLKPLVNVIKTLKRSISKEKRHNVERVPKKEGTSV